MSSWKDHVTAALIGPERAGALPSPVSLPPPTTPAADRTIEFLTQAGALALWRRAGWKPPVRRVQIRTAEPETTQPVSRASAAHLRAMLGKDFAVLLEEWLGEVARRGRHVPPELLPALLERARQQRDLRAAVMAAGGRRAPWLAAHNPAWSFGEEVSDADWETGNRDQRAEILRRLRATAPAEARAKVEAAWKTEPADTRTAFLVAMKAGLSADDVPFLETVLDDRSKEAMRAVIDLLARVPSSPFVARMIERVRPLLTYKKGGLLSRANLEVTLPGDPDAAGTRDCLNPKAFGQQKILGEKAVLLVLMLSAVPLRHWTESFQNSAEVIVKTAQKSEFARALATGWAWAALRQRDAAWAEALMDAAEQPHVEFLPREPLIDLLPEDRRAQRIAVAVRAGGLRRADPAVWHQTAALLRGLVKWPLPLAREVMEALQRDARTGGVPWHFREGVIELLCRLPPPLLPDAISGWSAGEEGVQPIIDLLRFRLEVLTALSQS